MNEHPLQKIHPDYLHTNSTSHRWVFGAIAELIDNAHDPDVAASRISIDQELINRQTCLTFVDNGRGMDLKKLTNMLSQGHCAKKKDENQFNKPCERPIGQYGNGFKCGSMRLAKDAVVLTVCQDSSAACVGLLSRTMCSARNLKQVRLPMIQYSLPGLQQSSSQSQETFSQSLAMILEYSSFHSEEELKAELRKLVDQKPSGRLKRVNGQKGSGTKIVLFNLNMNGRMLELDFMSDDHDIRNPETQNESQDGSQQQAKVFEYKQSLRRYCSILYQKPKLMIYIRKKKVKTCFMKRTLRRRSTYPCKPKGKSATCEITLGIPDKRSTVEDYGVMFYHRNRLITPYMKLGLQTKSDSWAVRVLGIVDVSEILQPTDIKQEFMDSTDYRKTLTQLARKVDNYCEQAESSDSSNREESNPCIWAQCDNCLQFRCLPEYAEKKLTETWFCTDNPDLTKNRCEVPEDEYSDTEYDLPATSSTAPDRDVDTNEPPASPETPVAGPSGYGYGFRSPTTAVKRESGKGKIKSEDCSPPKKPKLSQLSLVSKEQNPTQKIDYEVIIKQIDDLLNELSSPAKRNESTGKSQIKTQKIDIEEAIKQIEDFLDDPSSAAKRNESTREV